jgi:hypothetical protein
LSEIKSKKEEEEEKNKEVEDKKKKERAEFLKNQKVKINQEF